ncbi:MAG: twin-arginine translocase TatA/TatE family subunit [Thermodesulfobacteriota bacterium]
MFGLGFWELLLVLAIVVLIFGGRRLPDLGRALGETVREFRKVPERQSGEKEGSSGDKGGAETSGQARPLVSLEDLGRLGTRSGRLRLLGRWLTRGRS